MRVEILSRSGKPIIRGGLEVDAEATVEELKKALHKVKRKYYISRQRLTLPPEKGQRTGTVLQDSKKLSFYDIHEGSEIYFKDLGTQVSYGAVFFWEYFGPLMVYPIFYFFPDVYWWNKGRSEEKDLIQSIALAYWSFHYLKRIFETFHIHKFSHATMPIRNLFKNCSYYWGFAAYVSYFVNHPFYTPPSLTRAYILFSLAFFCELGNLYCHVLQRRLRGPGEKDYKIPHGFLFEYITCANYTMEIAGWLLFSVATQTLTSFLFTLAGAIQMAQWAAGKHKRLVKVKQESTKMEIVFGFRCSMVKKVVLSTQNDGK
eukprot:g1663.t1